MKKILLVGKSLANLPADLILQKNAEYFVASDLLGVQQVFEKKHGAIDIVIMGAGIELEKRLEIVKHVFETSDTTTVHMKDYATGTEGFVPFIHDVLTGLLHYN